MTTLLDAWGHGRSFTSASLEDQSHFDFRQVRGGRKGGEREGGGESRREGGREGGREEERGWRVGG